MILENYFLLVAFCYTLLFVGSLIQFIRTCWSYKAWTAQKLTHLFMAFMTLARTVLLFLVGFKWCGIASGEISSSCSNLERVLFYALDEFPGLMFFSIYSLMVLFWAEVYYNAIDRVQTYKYYVRRLGRGFNILAYVVQIIFWIFYATLWKEEKHYADRSYAVFTAFIFSFMALSFIWYGRKAYVELRSVPVELQIRKQKLQEVAVMTIVCTSCLTLRSVVLLWISNEKLQLHDSGTWAIIIVYFGVFEILPSLVILYFHRRLPARSDLVRLGYGPRFGYHDHKIGGQEHLTKKLLGREVAK